MIATPRRSNRAGARAYHETSENGGLISSADHWLWSHRLSLSDQLSLSCGPRLIGSACQIGAACQRRRSDQLSLSDRLSLWERGWPIGLACMISRADHWGGNHRTSLCSTFVLLCGYAHRRIVVRLYHSTPVLLRTILIISSTFVL